MKVSFIFKINYLFDISIYIILPIFFQYNIYISLSQNIEFIIILLFFT
jgi:hypothetical protein